jgi:hypothetical protein
MPILIGCMLLFVWALEIHNEHASRVDESAMSIVVSWDDARWAETGGSRAQSAIAEVGWLTFLSGLRMAARPDVQGQTLDDVPALLGPRLLTRDNLKLLEVRDDLHAAKLGRDVFRSTTVPPPLLLS